MNPPEPVCGTKVIPNFQFPKLFREKCEKTFRSTPFPRRAEHFPTNFSASTIHRKPEFPIFSRNTSEVLLDVKIIFYLCRAEQSANIFTESVFALSGVENVEVFQ